MRCTKSKLLSSTLGVAAVLTTAGLARAQSQTAPVAGSSADSISEVVVTATRIARQGYSAPTPTTVVGVQDIQASAPVNLADYINELPQLSGSTNPRGQGLASGNTSGANFLNLRALGPTRTLTLLDGRRVAPSVITGGVDVNVLPQGLVKRVEIVTGGASADWGSDAVAGVVNFVLDTRFTGVKLDVQGGDTEHAGARNGEVDFTYGKAFLDGKAHFLLDAMSSYAGTGDLAGTQSWYHAYKIINNPAATATNGLPPQIVSPGVGISQATRGGLITSGPLKGTQFTGPNGTPAPFNFGYVSGQLSQGGSAEDYGAVAPLEQPVRDNSAFSRFSYDFNDKLSVFSEFSYSKSRATLDSVPYMRFANITIRNDNAYLNPTVKAQLAAAGQTSFTLGSTNQNLGNSHYTLDRQLTRYLVGANGSFGGNWSWETYAQRGITKFVQDAGNDPNIAHYNLAIDAVQSPSGAIVCRSTLTAPTNGCVPLNLFGVSTISAAQRSYLLGNSHQPITFIQDVASATLRGEPLSVPAGKVSIAAGLEYRRESYSATSDALSQGLTYYLGNYQPSNGNFDVKEGFVETVVPIVRDLPLVKALDFNGAVRETDYSTSGSVTTWKLGTTWDVVDDLRLRATRSRDIRAANLAELFRAPAYQVTNVSDPVTSTTVGISQITQGNRNLTPEVADTTAFGVVINPRWLKGFEASVDYFNIDISSAIFTPTAQQTISFCAAGVTVLCSAITRNSTNAITSVIVQASNINSESDRGLDIEASYRLSLADLAPMVGGNLTFREFATHIDKRAIRGFGTVIDYAGTNADTTAVPSWKSIFTAAWNRGPFTSTATIRYIGSGRITNVLPLIGNGDVPAVTYLDLSLAYKFTLPQAAQAEAYFVVQNAFDKDPPVAPPSTASLNLISTGTNGYIYDILGRQFRGGIRLRF